MGCGLLLCDGILYGLQTQIGGNHYDGHFQAEKTGDLCRRRSVLNGGDKDSFEQRCKEGLHELYGSCFKGEGMRFENSDDGSGKRRGYPGGSSADQ